MQRAKSSQREEAINTESPKIRIALENKYKMTDLAASRKELAEDAKKKVVTTLENVQRSLEKKKEKFL